MAKSELGIIVTVFISVIIGIVLLGAFADEESRIRSSYALTDENVTVATNGVAVLLTYDDVVPGSVTVTNSSGAATTNFTITYGTGSIVFPLNTSVSGTNGPYQVDYSWYDDNYVHNGTARTLVNIVVLLFALAIIGLASMAFMGAFDKFKMR